MKLQVTSLFNFMYDSTSMKRVVFLELLLLCLLIKCGNGEKISETKHAIGAIHQNCDIKKEKVTVKEKGCQEKQVMVNYCAGHCPSYTSYQYKHPYYTSQCRCCKAKVMAVMYVMMTCGSNTVKIHPRNNVIKCECNMCRSRWEHWTSCAEANENTKTSRIKDIYWIIAFTKWLIIWMINFMR